MDGGSASDAALAIAAVLAVVEPCSTGLGGDMFALVYDAKTRDVKAINGSGRCAGRMNLDLLREKLPLESSNSDSEDKIDGDAFCKSVYSITTPGAARGWEEFYHHYCSKKFTFAQLLEPAAVIAESGFPVSVMTAQAWQTGLKKDVLKWCSEEDVQNGKVPLSVDGRGRGPNAGEIMVNRDMARVLRSLGKYGATKGFYNAFPGQAIVDAVQKHGGVMTMDDFTEEHTKCTFPETIYVEYKGVKLHQVPPNGQGVAGLIALSGLDALEKKGTIDAPAVVGGGTDWKSSQTWHAMIEMMRLGFADARAFVCDTDFCLEKCTNVEGTEAGVGVEMNIKSNEFLLDAQRISDRAERMFHPNKAVVQGVPDPSNGTVSFQVVDGEGNAVSFVNSNYDGFGSGLVPDGCGFTLQNRGFGFSLEKDHPNAMEPYKRPYHTIIPGILTHADTDELYATISNMGGFMQPQGHMQLTVGMVSGGLDPQAAIDMPRFCISDGTHNGAVYIEEGVDGDTISELRSKKHNMQCDVSGYDRTVFGKAQIIKRDRETGVLWAGSDGRADGCACGF